MEGIFNSGLMRPCNEHIQMMGMQLEEYGQLNDVSVLYWFQNRKSRTKRKRLQLQIATKKSECLVDSESTWSLRTPPNQYNTTNIIDSTPNLAPQTLPSGVAYLEQRQAHCPRWRRLQATNTSTICRQQMYDWSLNQERCLNNILIVYYASLIAILHFWWIIPYLNRIRFIPITFKHGTFESAQKYQPSSLTDSTIIHTKAPV